MKSKTAITARFTLTRLLPIGLALNFMLVLPAWWRDGAIGSVWLAPEAWLLPAFVAWRPLPRFANALRLLLAVLLAFVILAGSFDGLVQSVLGRPLNIFVDALMLRAGFHLIDGSVGRWAAIAACVIVAAAALAIAWSVNRLLCAASRPTSRDGPPGPMTIVTTTSTTIIKPIVLATLLLSLPWVEGRLPGVESQVLGLVSTQAGQLEATRSARRRLVRAVEDPVYEARALPGLAGRDVYVVFIESYGASALDQPRYADRIVPLLRDSQARLQSAGLAAVSGRLESPIRGGQSWLAHATLLGGLRIDSQLWYRMLLALEIDLLSDDFRATGHTALNVAPAIVRDWPEGEALGFDGVYAAANLGYQGPPLGWVTMPDEFTLHTFSRKIRPRYPGAVYAQIALISSHWPWTPVPKPLPDPTRLDNGEIYGGRVPAAEKTSLFRLGRSGLHRAYAGSIAYSLEVTLAWAVRSLPEDALLIVLGDHQPTSLITGREAGAAVPIHVISGERALLDAFRQRSFVAGLVPSSTAKPADMERLRHWLRDDFSPH